MTSWDVMQACKKRLARHAASYLEITDSLHKESNAHTCIGSAIEGEDGLLMKECVGQPSLFVHESY